MKKIKDNMFKSLFTDTDLFYMLLKDFIKEDWVDIVEKSNLELVSSSFVDSIETNRESDIIYKVKLEDEEIFVFILLEHQSKVNYLMIFRVLEYMVKLWRKYIDDNKKISLNKSFLLPPIYPIIFYDGSNEWTAVKNFQEKVKDAKSFKEYLPDFKYDIISLRDISYEELQNHKDLLSAIMLIDKIKKPSDFEEIKNIKKEYWEGLKKNIGTRRELEKIAEAMKILLKRINVPEAEIEEVIENVYDGRLNKMFEMAVHYDVQETRMLGKLEGKLEGKKEGKLEGKLEVARNLIKNGVNIEIIMLSTGLSKEELKKLEEI